jgi:hypothetical protein
MDGLDFEFAVEQAIDDGANKRGATHRLSGAFSDVVDEAIEPRDLSIEQNHRHFGPSFRVDRWAPPAPFLSACEQLSSGALRDHQWKL